MCVYVVMGEGYQESQTQAGLTLSYLQLCLVVHDGNQFCSQYQNRKVLKKWCLKNCYHI